MFYSRLFIKKTYLHFKKIFFLCPGKFENAMK